MASRTRIPVIAKSFFSGAKDSSPEARAVWHRMMQETQPVRYQPDYDLWEIYRYDDVERVVTEYSTFSATVAPEEFPGAGGAGGLNSDPPDHHRYRTLAGKAFTSRRINELGPRVTAIVDEVLEQGSREGKLDIVQQLAYPLPVRVIGEMLGVPPEDQERFRNWSYQLLGFMPNPADPTSSGLRNYFAEQLNQRLQEPRDDMMSALLTAEMDGGDRMTLDQVLTLCMVLLGAGNITTIMLLSFAARRFVKQPEIFQQLRHDPSLIPGALEELLRHDFAHFSSSRVARCDTVIGGQEIKEGQMVLAWLSSANFDETHFPHAEQFDIRRSPNPHLTFGHGIHYCLGAPLVRFTGKIVLERMVTHWSDIQSDPELPLKYVNEAIDLIQSFPIYVTPAK
jgi:cytochrome P450 family 109